MASFRQILISWYETAHRELPWRQTTDPYRIWLSETMLQQTRAAAAIPYYERFLARFPDLAALARAPESEVLAAWSGLGYYHRARNLLKAAQEIDREGAFPNSHAAIRALPGVGDYTAAAVGSIAFGLPHAVLDGNVLRVVARLTADGGDIGSGKTRRRFQETVDTWLDPAQPGAFNQAMMELGATVCLPRNPQCLLCPVAQMCGARASGRQTHYPVKAPKAVPRTAESQLLLIERDGSILLQQRPETASRMAGFWELPDRTSFPEIESTLVGSFSHTIVNTRWTVTVSRAGWGSKRVPASMRWIEKTAFTEVPVTTVTKKALILASSR